MEWHVMFGTGLLHQKLGRESSRSPSLDICGQVQRPEPKVQSVRGSGQEAIRRTFRSEGSRNFSHCWDFRQKDGGQKNRKTGTLGRLQSTGSEHAVFLQDYCGRKGIIGATQQMKLPVQILGRWFLSLPAVMFCCVAASGMYANFAWRDGIAGLAAMIARVLLSSSIALWILADARKRGRPMPYDAGSFLYFAWPVLAPVYLFKTRGWGAFAVLGWFGLLYFTAVIFSQIPAFFAEREW
jgi:hypothetical protein